MKAATFVCSKATALELKVRNAKKFYVKAEKTPDLSESNQPEPKTKPVPKAKAKSVPKAPKKNKANSKARAKKA